MTPDTLREIAEEHSAEHRSSEANGFPVSTDCSKCFLLDALVEERARPIRVLKVLNGLRDGNDEQTTNITDEDRTQALTELGLGDGVWPIRGVTNVNIR